MWPAIVDLHVTTTTVLHPVRLTALPGQDSFDRTRGLAGMLALVLGVLGLGWLLS